MKLDLGGALTAAALLTVAAVALASPEDDRASVAALDTQYQAAVKRNDAETMGRILADDFVLVLGNGKTYTRAGPSRIRTCRQDRLRAPGRGRGHADCPGLGRHGCRDGAALAQGCQ